MCRVSSNTMSFLHCALSQGCRKFQNANRLLRFGVFYYKVKRPILQQNVVLSCKLCDLSYFLKDQAKKKKKKDITFEDYLMTQNFPYLCWSSMIAKLGIFFMPCCKHFPKLFLFRGFKWRE